MKKFKIKKIYYECNKCPDENNCRYKNLKPELTKERYCFHKEMIHIEIKRE